MRGGRQSVSFFVFLGNAEIGEEEMTKFLYDYASHYSKQSLFWANFVQIER